MTLPAVKLAETLAAGPGTAPTPGVDGFVALVPLAALAAVGEPPILPALCRRAGVAAPARVAAGVAGYAISSGVGAAGGRPGPVTFRVTWGPMSEAESGTLKGWLDADLGTGPGGSARAMTLRPDGPDGDAASVRLTAAPVWRQGPGGLWTVEAEAEQV